jgi:hypothetical protein
VFGTSKYQAPWRYLELSKRKAHLYAAEVEADIGEIAQLVSATAITKQTIDSSVDVTDLLIDLDYGYELFPAFSGYTKQNVKYDQFNQEIRLVSKHGGPFSWVLGGSTTTSAPNRSIAKSCLAIRPTPGSTARTKWNMPRLLTVAPRKRRFLASSA